METLSLSLSKRKNNCSKTFAFPKLIYPLHVLANPKQSIIQDITTKMYSYLWDGKPDKIKRDIIIQDYKNGGLKMIDIESKIAGLKSTWVHRIIYNSNSVIVRLYKTHLKQLGENLFFECNMQTKDVDELNISSTFLKDVLYSWTKASYTEPTCIGKEIICHFLSN